MHPSLGPPPSLGRYTVTYTTQLPSKRPLSPRPLCVSDNLYFSYSIISGMGRQNQPNDKEGGRRVSCLGPTTEPVPSPTDGLSPDDDGRILKKLDCRCHVAGGGGVMWRAIEAILLPRPIRHRRCCITIYKQLRGELQHKNWRRRREESAIRDETVSHCMRYSRLLREPGVILSRRNGRLALSTGYGASGLWGGILLVPVGFLKFSHALMSGAPWSVPERRDA